MTPVVRFRVSRLLGEIGEFVFAEPDVFVVGRSPECHCSVPDDIALSASHFIIEVNPPECVLRDLGSRNGTFVNGERCGMRREGEPAEEAARRAKRVPLKDGDVVIAGTVELRVRVEKSEAPPPAPPAPSDPRPAPRAAGVPGFSVLGRIGSGGLGTVYRARRAEGGAEVALKLIPFPEGAASGRKEQALQREASVALGLRHPNIVRFLGCGRSGADFYCVMELCAGGSLAGRMRAGGGRLSLGEAAPLMRQVLEGLEYAHGQGIVHRDVKPENILLGGEAGLTAKLSDLGLAKNFMLAGFSGITEAETSSGTLAFMPKEQLLNFRFVKPASDVFSTGATFYTMLTGRYVYDFDSVEDPVQAILAGKIVPLRERGVALPEALTRLIDRAISPDPEGRFADAAEMKRAFVQAF